MTTLWTTPRTWVRRDGITKDRLNAISDQLRYLYAPSAAIATVRGTGADVTTTSTTPAAIDDTALTLTVETTGRVLSVSTNFTVSNSTAGQHIIFDILIDGTTYLSSLSTSPLTNGLWRMRQVTGAYVFPLNMSLKIPADALTVGVHTFVPRFWVSANTGTCYMSAGYFAQFAVGEG